MPKQITNRSLKNADLRKKQLAKLAELEARDEFEKKWAMQDLTSPEKVGLSNSHASLISDKLKQAYINKEILSQFDDDDEADDVDDEIEDEEDSVEDDIEFSEPEDSDEQDEPKAPSEKKPSIDDFPKSKEESPAEGLGMGNLEEELTTQEDEEDLGFPSEESDEDIIGDPLVTEDSDILPIPGMEEEMGPILEDESSVELDPGQDEVILELPGGQKLSLKLLENLAQAPMEENMMAAAKTNSVQDRKAQRREVIANILREAGEQSKTEQIKPGSQPGSHKNLGDDTSSQGKPYVMEDATRGVANPGLTSNKMTLESSEGNSLLSNPNFTPNEVPTVNPEMIANNPDAYDINKFSQGESGLFTQKMDGTATPIPTMGDKDSMWGEKGMQDGFEPPTQLDSTLQRRTNVLAGKIVECAGCYNEEDTPLSVVACDTCGNQYPLCSHCIEDDECPVCASNNEENVREATGPNYDAYCKTPKDREEICEDIRGDGDVNNDGGFRVKRTEDDDQCDGNYDLEVNASVKVKKLERENQELQLTLAKFAKAVEAATVMAYGDTINVTDIPAQVTRFMEDRSANASSLEHVRQTLAALAKKHNQTKLGQIERGMEKGASAPRVSPVGYGYNPNPSQERPFEAMNDMREALKGVFTYPKKHDEE